LVDIEIFSKEWCPYCAKAKTLLKSKGLEYSEIDITNDVKLQREMIKRSGMRSVPQIFIGGESIGGYDGLASLNASGELDRRLGLESPIDLTKVYDVVVVGAGPAGMTAAIYAARKNLSTLIVALDIGGQVGTTADILNYPGFDYVTGPDLVQRLFEQVEAHAIDKLIGEKIVGLEADARIKTLRTASGRALRTKTVIIASGVQKRRLNVPGERELTGKGVVYCSTCDGPLFKGATIAIVGGGNSALEAALEMDGLARHIYLVSLGDWTGDPILQDKVVLAKHIEALKDHETVKIHGKTKVDGITVRDVASGAKRRLDVTGVFIEVGVFPNTDFVLDLLGTNQRGEIVAGSHGDTGLRGIFAAGDATEGDDKQIVIAAGEGAKAALGAFEYIIKQY
jgi:alkyl hydroperoxide reductase subunit F